MWEQSTVSYGEEPTRGEVCQITRKTGVTSLEDRVDQAEEIDPEER